MNKILTISIAAYNAEKWLETCLNSFVIPEIIDDIEAIIINDGSTDGTSMIAEKYVSKYPHTFILMNKENGGHGSTINAGIKAATGKYFKLVDADDWVEKAGLINLVHKARACSADAIISPYYKYYMTENNRRLQNVFSKKNAHGHYIDRKIEIGKVSDKCEFSLPALTIKTSLLKEKFTEITEKCFFVDMEYDVFYSCYLSTVLLSDVPVYVYRLGNNEQSVALTNMVKRRDELFTVCKSILEFYESVSESIPDINLQIVKKMIIDIVANQARVLLEVSDVCQSKKELLSFVTYLKTKHQSLYRDIIKRGLKEGKETIIFIPLMEKTGFKFYGLVHKMVHLTR